MAEIVERTDSRVAAVTGPIYLLLFPIPVVCFIGALLTDLTYMSNAVIEWLNFSEWLIAAGLVFGAFAALASLIELIAAFEVQHRRLGPHLPVLGGDDRRAVQRLRSYRRWVDGGGPDRPHTFHHRLNSRGARRRRDLLCPSRLGSCPEGPP